MSIYNRFFGKRESDDGPDDLVAGLRPDDAPALQLLFADIFRLDPGAVTEALRAYHPSMAQARCEVADDLKQEQKLFGLLKADPFCSK